MIALNTRAVGYTGVALAILGLLLDSNFQTALFALLPAASIPIVSKVLTLIGVAAAYFGMPRTVSASTTPPVPPKG